MLNLNRAVSCEKKVAIARTDRGLKEGLRACLDEIGGLKRYIGRGDAVFVKPNLAGPREPLTGAVTNPEVAKVVIELIYELGASKVLLGDSPSWGFDTAEVFSITGYAKVAAETGCSLVNLDTEKATTCKIIDAWRLKEASVSKRVIECDKLVNVPVMKTHMQAVVTLGLKNMKGILPRKWKTRLHNLEPMGEHAGLDVGIADLHRLLKPDLTIVDGTICMEGRGPLDGTPVKLGLVVVGQDAVLTDSVCAKIMGFDPDKISSIKCAGEIDGVALNSYEISGLPLESARRNFEPCPTEVYHGENIFINTGAVCSGCLATLNTAIHRLIKSGELNEIEDLEIRVGKDAGGDIRKERVLFVGKCAIPQELSRAARKEKTAPGCPPMGTKIVAGIRNFR